MPEVSVLPTLAAILFILRVSEFLRDVKRRQQHVAFQDKAFALRLNVRHRPDGIREISENALHVLGGLQVPFLVRHAESKLTSPFPDVTLGFGHICRVLDAQQNVVGVGLVLSGVIGVVRCDVLDVMLGTKLQQRIIDHTLFLQAMPVEFGVKIGTKLALPPQKRLLRLRLTNVQDQGGHLAEKSSCCHDDVVRVRSGQKFLVDAGHIIESLRVGRRTELRQPVIAGFVFRQENHGVAIVLVRFVEPIPANIQFRTDNGFQALLVCCAHKLKGRHHVARIGHSQSRHAHVHCRIDQLVDFADGLQNGELTVHVQMREGDICQGCCTRCCLIRDHGPCLFLRRFRLKVRRFQLRRLVADGIRIFETWTLNDAQFAQLKETLRCRIHVVGGIVRLRKRLSKQLRMKFCQRRPFESTASSTRNGAVIRRLVLGIDQRFFRQSLEWQTQTVQFSPDDVHIKTDVVPHHVSRLQQIRFKRCNDLIQRAPLAFRSLRRDAVNLCGIEWNGESIRANNPVATRHQASAAIVQLPRQLDQPRPIVAIGQRGIPIAGQTRGLSIVDEEHDRASY